MFDIIFLSILIFAILGASFIIVRKFPQLKSIDTSIITKEIQDKQKKDLLKERLDRKIKGFIIKENKENVLERTQNKIKETIKKTQEAKDLNYIDKISKDPEKKVFYMNELADSIKKNIDEENYVLAEDLCYQYLKLDKDNILALDMLSSVYYSTSEYQKSIETYEYMIGILKKNKNKDNIKENNQKMVKYYIKIADIYFNENNFRKVADILKHAFLIDENNPKILDLLIESYINLKDRFMAERTLKKMETANPENSKISDFKERIEKMFKKK